MANRNGGTVAEIVTIHGARLSLGWTPETSVLSGGGWKYSKVDRDGRLPLSSPDVQTPYTLSFTTHLYENQRIDVAGTIAAAQRMARPDDGSAPVPVRLNGVAGHERARIWRIVGLSISVTRRNIYQAVAAADLSWQFEEYVPDTTPSIGKTRVATPTVYASVVKSQSAYNEQVPSAASRPAPPSSYVVRGTDSLYTIAQNLYGDGSKWTWIAQKNLLPTATVTPGDVLRIPANGSDLSSSSPGQSQRRAQAV